jgi:LysM repeat protein
VPAVDRALAARLLAPAAFLAGVTIAVVLIRVGLHGGEDETATQPRATGTATAAQTTAPPPPTTTTTATPEPVFVRVEAGGTLDQIAVDNDTTVERLLELNPGIDPTGLRIGQRVRVR